MVLVVCLDRKSREDGYPGTASCSVLSVACVKAFHLVLACLSKMPAPD